MVKIVTDKELRSVRDLPFCYLCGKKFEVFEDSNHDHVPPESVFSKTDRRQLKLATHYTCNHSQTDIDEKIGQFISLSRGHVPRQVQNRKLRFQTFQNTPGVAALQNLDVKEALWRWLRGFHTALYREYLSNDVRGSIETPFVEGKITFRGVELEELKDQHLVFVEVIKYNRIKNKIDRIVCNNNKLIYECTWVEDDDGRWMCFFCP